MRLRTLLLCVTVCLTVIGGVWIGVQATTDGSADHRVGPSRNKQAASTSAEHTPARLVQPPQVAGHEEIQSSTVEEARHISSTAEEAEQIVTQPLLDESKGEDGLVEEFRAKYEGKGVDELLRARRDLSEARTELAVPLMDALMEEGRFEEYPPLNKGEMFNLTEHFPDVKQNPMIQVRLSPLGDGRTVPKVVRLQPDVTPEIQRIHQEVLWLTDRIAELR